MKHVIGWREYVDFPEWDIYKVRAKVDTGARTSSLHVEDVTLLKGNRIRFYVILRKKNIIYKKKVVTARLKVGSVKSSIGVKTKRWFVETKLKIGSFEKDIVINLVNREDMNFRMLLGRNALHDQFLVDVNRSFVLGSEYK
jgi:hypothetical protein